MPDIDSTSARVRAKLEHQRERAGDRMRDLERAKSVIDNELEWLETAIEEIDAMIGIIDRVP